MSCNVFRLKIHSPLSFFWGGGSGVADATADSIMHALFTLYAPNVSPASKAPFKKKNLYEQWAQPSRIIIFFLCVTISVFKIIENK